MISSIIYLPRKIPRPTLQCIRLRGVLPFTQCDRGRLWESEWSHYFGLFALVGQPNVRMERLARNLVLQLDRSLWHALSREFAPVSISTTFFSWTSFALSAPTCELSSWPKMWTEAMYSNMYDLWRDHGNEFRMKEWIFPAKLQRSDSIHYDQTCGSFAEGSISSQLSPLCSIHATFFSSLSLSIALRLSVFLCARWCRWCQRYPVLEILQLRFRWENCTASKHNFASLVAMYFHVMSWTSSQQVLPRRERPEIPKPIWHPPWKLMRVMLAAWNCMFI